MEYNENIRAAVEARSGDGFSSTVFVNPSIGRLSLK
jgi:hypothetical protein